MMPDILKWLPVACALLVVEAAADEVRLSADEINALLPGNRMVEENPKRGGGRATLDWKSNGRVFGKTQSGHSDKGEWWLVGDQYCRRWNKWADGETTCWTLTLDGRTLAWYDENGEKVGSGELKR